MHEIPCMKYHKIKYILCTLYMTDELSLILFIGLFSTPNVNSKSTSLLSSSSTADATTTTTASIVSQSTVSETIPGKTIISSVINTSPNTPSPSSTSTVTTPSPTSSYTTTTTNVPSSSSSSSSSIPSTFSFSKSTLPATTLSFSTTTLSSKTSSHTVATSVSTSNVITSGVSSPLTSTTSSSPPQSTAGCPNILVNGDFESTASQHCHSRYCFLSDNKSIAPWYISSGPYYEIDFDPWPAYSGNWSVDLNSDFPYAISQSVSLAAGKRYTLSFMLNSNAYCGPDVKSGFVTASGSPNLLFTHTATSQGWIKIMYDFTALYAAKHVITIASTTTGTCGPVIDMVYLAAADCGVSPSTTTPTPTSTSSPSPLTVCSSWWSRWWWWC